MAEKIPKPWKMPPLIKVYEALGAIADSRVQIQDERHAAVVSSEGNKTYAVEIVDREVAANDNASYWQGYLGYPAIAVMIMRSLLAADRDAISALGRIPWKELNRRFRNDYARAIVEVDQKLSANGIDPATIKAECEKILAALRAYAPIQGARRRPPRAQ
jgi:hypothetical protein